MQGKFVAAIVLMFVAGLGATLKSGPYTNIATQERKTMSVKKLTPVLVVEEIEPCVKWWVERMGFEKTVEAPEGNNLGFVILVKDGVEIMYQSRASVEKDVPGMLQGGLRATTGLFIEVSDIEDVVRRMKGAEIVVARRKTFYGADEIGVREPGGSVVIFAQIAAQ